MPPGGAIRVYCVDPSLYNPCGVVEDAELVDEALSRDRAHLSLEAMIDMFVLYDWMNSEKPEGEHAYAYVNMLDKLTRMSMIDEVEVVVRTHLGS